MSVNEVNDGAGWDLYLSPSGPEGHVPTKLRPELDSDWLICQKEMVSLAVVDPSDLTVLGVLAGLSSRGHTPTASLLLLSGLEFVG